MSEKFEMVAKTFQGLEGVLSDELQAIGASDVLQGKRMVSFTGDKEMMYRANFCLRTALRILKPIYKFRSTDADDLYNQVKRFEWGQFLTADTTFSIDATVFSESFRHSRFVTYRVKDAIADYFMERDGKRPSIRLNNPDIQLDVHISNDEVTISLDSSGEPLYKRGWRVAQTDAPINEVLAAGIIKLSGWDGQSNLVDPMCGSGTFLIEAALIAANINPGVYRKEYAFQHWADYDQDLFETIYNDDSGEREFEYKIYGSDIAIQAVDIAKRNIKSAGVAKMIEVKQQDLRNITECPENGILITNPPYGTRLKYDDIDSLYTSIGEKMKKVFKGYHCWLIVYNDDLASLIGLKPSVNYPLLNGELECELREYVIFEGRYSDMRREGGDIKNHDFRASDKDRGARRPRFKETFEDGEKEREKGRREQRPHRDSDRGERRPRRDDNRSERRPRRDSDYSERRPRRDNDRNERRPRRDGDDRKPRRFEKRDGERLGQHTPRYGEHPRADRNNDGSTPDRRPRKEGLMDRDEFFHSDKFAKQVLQHREPTLSKDSEVPIVRGRRNGWRKKDQ